MIDDDEEDRDILEIEQENPTGSSATATLDGRTENEIDYEDNNEEPVEENGDPSLGIDEAAVDGGQLDEIDWRDFPDEPSNNDLKETMSTSGKRPHAEVNDGEEFDLDEGIGMSPGPSARPDTES